MAKPFRTETDALGEVAVPADALWGASTQRALVNFPVSGRRFPFSFIRALALTKRAAAEANGDLALLDKRLASAIAQAAAEVADSKHNDQFPLDIFQTGSGTSTNMNANEVIANLANLRLGGKPGKWEPVHPNDHVNKGQSSNDVIPSSLHVAAAEEINGRLIPALNVLQKSLGAKARQFHKIPKIGRTHLMDALPLSLGQEFSGWARQVEKCISYLRGAMPFLLEIAIGGTAVGTGAGTHPKFATAICGRLKDWLNLEFRPAANYFEALASRGPCVQASGALTTCATTLARIADDIRLLASGPRLGLGELVLPTLQPGSSMMPGKVNPVMPEMICQVGSQVIANHTAVTVAALGGHLELNTQLPVMASNLLESIDILSNAATLFSEKCIEGIAANETRCRENIESSLALATTLVPKIGYDKASEVAKEAARTGKNIREIARELKIASDEELHELLDVEKLIRRK